MELLLLVKHKVSKKGETNCNFGVIGVDGLENRLSCKNVTTNVV